jgi:DNA-binding CsgD family transcriptional regulator
VQPRVPFRPGGGRAHVRLSARPAPDANAFAQTVAALGSASFAGELLAALNRLVFVDHLSLMRFADRLRAPVLESAVWRGGEHVAQVQRAYLQGLYRHDPNLRLAGTRLAPTLIRLRREGLADPAYREACYARPGLAERLSLVQCDGGPLVALNLYRRDQSGAFRRGELAVIEAHAGLLAALAAKHVSMLGVLLRSRARGDRIAAAAARLHALDGRLPRRELEVLARILAGMTSEGIALDLGIAANTVLTYRKRGYGRLRVSSQAELFSLCLS